MKLRVRCRNGLVFFLLLVGFSAAPNSAFSNGTPAAQPPDVAQEQILKLLSAPLPLQIKPQETPAFYKPDSLYQYIDGGADVYLLYDFRVLLHQDFKNGDAEFTADIYDMGRPEDAFGIYAAERSTRYKFVPIGIEGYRSKGIFNFVQDRYYVKLAGMNGNVDTLLDSFARIVSQRIGGTRTAPALLGKLPAERRVPHSEQYVRKDPLGHSFLAPAYLVTYAWGAQEGKLVVTVAADSAGAKARLDQLAKHFRETGECKPAADLGEGGIRAKNSFEGRVIARTQGRYLIALVNPPENGPEILKATAQGLL
jgi:hypothetical protein